MISETVPGKSAGMPADRSTCVLALISEAPVMAAREWKHPAFISAGAGSSTYWPRAGLEKFTSAEASLWRVNVISVCEPSAARFTAVIGQAASAKALSGATSATISLHSVDVPII